MATAQLYRLCTQKISEGLLTSGGFRVWGSLGFRVQGLGKFRARVYRV